MKRLLCIAIVALSVTGAFVAASAVAGSGGAPIVAQPLGVGRATNTLDVHVAKGTKLVYVRVTVRPGGDFGWHVHHGAVAATVLSGTLTLYDSSDPSCSPESITPGEGFMEPVNHIHLARNEGTTPVHVLVTYLGVPPGQSLDAPAAQPAQCKDVN
jgi:quercetin dioxygenase-like cupin family protein